VSAQSSTAISTRPDVSIIVGTKNRAASLDRALASILSLSGSFELIVSDNASTDETRACIERWCGRDDRVRYVYEPRPGVAHARNTAVAIARAPIVAFLDDDEEATPEWLAAVTGAFDQHPEIEAIGGPLLPVWATPPPAWLRGRDLGGVVSLIDGGDRPFRVGARRWFCFASGNLALRRDTLLRLGGFNGSYRRSEDRELLVRLMLQGGEGLFVPSMAVLHHVEGQRLTRAYFRWWYATEGSMRGGFAFEELFLTGPTLRPLPADAPRVLGVAPVIYKRLLAAIVRWTIAMLRWRPDAAFRHELRVRYLWRYLLRRHADEAGESLAVQLRRLVADTATLCGMKLRRS
jgi:glycosyltransferase involved in cell wall biosynthesis